MTLERMQKIRGILTSEHLDGILISNPSNIYYLTGYAGFSATEREAFILITPNDAFLFTDGRYSEAAGKHIEHFQLLEISHKAPFGKLFHDVAVKKELSRIGFEANDITYHEYMMLTKSHLTLVPANLINLRVIKDQWEIIAIEKACKLGDDVFTYACKHIHAGITEKELAAQIELYLKEHGADAAFRPIVAFGSNASMPHHENTTRKLVDNEFILLDLGARLDNYCSDMSRTVFHGKPSNQDTQMYDIVLRAQADAISYITQHLEKKKDISAMDVDNASRKVILEHGYPQFPHSLGHGTGIQVHESPGLSPLSKDILTEGMVFSLEPGIYMANKVGIRIEDLVTIQDNVLRILTHSPKELLCL